MTLQQRRGSRQWHPTPVLLHRKSHGQGSLEGCSPWGRWGSDTTKWLHFHFSLSCIEEGNGNPLQCSCLENPRDGGAWWADVCGVTQSRTRLKWLSSTSSSNMWIHPYLHPVQGRSSFLSPAHPVPRILQARTLVWVAISFSSAGKWKVKVKSLSRVQLLATPWTAAYQAPPSMRFSRQGYWSGVPLPSLQVFSKK